MGLETTIFSETLEAIQVKDIDCIFLKTGCETTVVSSSIQGL